LRNEGKRLRCGGAAGETSVTLNSLEGFERTTHAQEHTWFIFDSDAECNTAEGISSLRSRKDKVKSDVQVKSKSLATIHISATGNHTQI